MQVLKHHRRRGLPAGKRGVYPMKINMKRLSIVLLVVACVFVLAGIILLAFLVPHASSGFYAFCLGAISVLGILCGLAILFFLYLARDNDPNFFLYDTKTAANIPASELTFERVNSRMSYFMTTLATSQEKLWVDNVLASEDAGRFGVNGVYRPLAAYKMLYDLIELKSDDGWRLFLCATRETVDTLCGALMANGEDAMANSLHHAYDSASGRDDIDWVRDFISGNEKYIRRRMLGYVQKNLEWFY